MWKIYGEEKLIKQIIEKDKRIVELELELKKNQSNSSEVRGENDEQKRNYSQVIHTD